jgi:DNA-binding beta-propeller fold protein YncE
MSRASGDGEGDGHIFEQGELQEDLIKLTVLLGCSGAECKLTEKRTITISEIKQKLSMMCELAVRQQSVFVVNDSRDLENLELKNDETVADALGYSAGSTTELQLAVMSDLKLDSLAHFVANMAPSPDLIISTKRECYGVAFVPAFPNFIITTSWGGNQLNIYDRLQNGKLVCLLGNENGRSGSGEQELNHPRGVVVTADSAFMIVADNGNSRLQVFALSACADGSTVTLAFLRTIGGGGVLKGPGGLSLRCVKKEGEEERQTVLVTERAGNRVSEFELDGTLIRRIGEGVLDEPFDVTALAQSGEIAVVQLSDSSVMFFEGESGTALQKTGPSNGLNKPSTVTSDPNDAIVVLDNSVHMRGFDAQSNSIFNRRDVGVRGGMYGQLEEKG